MNPNANAPNNEQAGRVRDRSKTEEALRLALTKIRQGGEKLSISSLAKEAGVTASLIHNRYPDFAEAVRIATGKDVRSQRDAKSALLTHEQDRNRKLQTEVSNLRKEIVDLASINEALRAELALQAAIATGRVTRISS